MNNTPKVSVIMPAYNAEKFLVEALESVIDQSMDSSEYEVIIVNDGSTDHTLEILRDYEARHENFKVIDKENGGPSSARNMALDVARGQSYFFFDSDDIMDKNALEMLYNRMVETGADLVISKYDCFDEVRTRVVHHIDQLVVMDDIDKFNLNILDTFIMTNKLYRSEIINKHHIRFAPISYSEDGVFLFDFLYWAEKIAGLDEIVFHYRKFDSVNGGSITSTISESKVGDYITAHRTILDLAAKSLEKRDLEEINTDKKNYSPGLVHEKFDADEPVDNEEEFDYSSAQEEVDAQTYISEILRKEIRVLLLKFYPQFWRLDQGTINRIVDEIHHCVPRLDMSSFAMISHAYPMYSLMDLDRDRESVRAKMVFTAILYGDKDSRDDFLNCLLSLVNQDLIFIRILVPESMKSVVEESGFGQGNIEYGPGQSEEDFIIKAVEKTETEFVCVADRHFIYAATMFSYAAKLMNARYVDFLSEVVYHGEYGTLQPVIYSRIVADSFVNGYEYNPALVLDRMLANKFFRTAYLKENIAYYRKGMDDFIIHIYKNGYYRFKYDRKVIFGGGEEAFREFIRSEESEAYLEDYLDDSLPSLLDSKVRTNEGKASLKLLRLKEDDPEEAEIQKYIDQYKDVRPKDQVAFLSIRSDGSLEGNALALYDQMKGCKKVCFAARLPHDSTAIHQMVKLIMTSRVIVTDDYLKYVRYIPLRPQQRLIQLWHACGAFKKFGMRGTNLSAKVDAATHAQYNLVCVSGRGVRGIYADAFSIEVNKVHALGVPRTDRFYDRTLKEKTAETIYQAHPDFRGKHLILYAPTFRDIGQDRTQFHPNIDFDALSRDLAPDQILVICPHPVMQNDIVDKEYDNIRVLRDFPTNDYMMVSDMLITDYSSVIFEYALLEKPIVFFCYDAITYNRGFYLKYPEDLPGPVFHTQNELTDYLREIRDYKPSQEAGAFVDRYMDACDGHSAERLAGLIRDYIRIPYILMTDKYRNLKKGFQAKNASGLKKMIGRFMQSWEDKYGL